MVDGGTFGCLGAISVTRPAASDWMRGMKETSECEAGAKLVSPLAHVLELLSPAGGAVGEG